MPSYKEYFDKIAYDSKYHTGDRVVGSWNKIPFVGTVGNDNRISEEEGPRVSVQLDLPLKWNDSYRSILIVKHKDIRPLPLWK